MEMKPSRKFIGVGVNVGMYDTIDIYQRCPFCGDYQHFDAQTKNLNSCMYTYHPIREGKDLLDRKKIPVFAKFPKDKSARVWKSQTEHSEAEATVPKEFSKLKFVHVIADCHSDSCQLYADLMMGYYSGFGRTFDGKIKIKNGKLTGEIYDIEK